MKIAIELSLKATSEAIMQQNTLNRTLTANSSHKFKIDTKQLIWFHSKIKNQSTLQFCNHSHA